MINTNDYLLLAGDPSKWDEEARQRLANFDHPEAISRDQQTRGRRSTEILYRYNTYRLDYCDEERQVSYPSLQDVVKAGKEWVTEDPSNRELCARKDLPGIKDLNP